MIKWIRTNRLSIKNSLSCVGINLAREVLALASRLVRQLEPLRRGLEEEALRMLAHQRGHAPRQENLRGVQGWWLGLLEPLHQRLRPYISLPPSLSIYVSLSHALSPSLSLTHTHLVAELEEAERGHAARALPALRPHHLPSAQSVSDCLIGE